MLLYLLDCLHVSVPPLSVTETMAVDSMLPSPSSISTPMLGLEGLPGRRRKKRTSIETNVRVVLERNFNAVGDGETDTKAQDVPKMTSWHSEYSCLNVF